MFNWNILSDLVVFWKNLFLPGTRSCSYRSWICSFWNSSYQMFDSDLCIRSLNLEYWDLSTTYISEWNGERVLHPRFQEVVGLLKAPFAEVDRWNRPATGPYSFWTVIFFGQFQLTKGECAFRQKARAYIRFLCAHVNLPDSISPWGYILHFHLHFNFAIDFITLYKGKQHSQCRFLILAPKTVYLWFSICLKI